MKSLYYKIIIALIVLVSNSSCDNYMDIHQDFIKEGERMYAPMLDSVTVFAGHNRVVLKLRYYNGNNLDKSVIYWNDYLDSMSVSLKSFNISKGLDSIEINISNLSENSYSFNIVNYDLFGNKSLSTPAFGSSYGEQYQNSINNRNIKERFNWYDDFYIRWSAAPDQLLKTEVKYINEQNKEVVESRGLEDESVYSKSKNNSFVYRSAYLPEENAVDIFYTKWSDPISL